METVDQEPRATGAAAALARMPTGAKVFLILVGALLPLALIALFTTLQTTRSADSEARQRVRALAEESSGIVQNVLANHVGQLRETMTALEQDPDDAPSCTRLAGTFATQGGVRFVINDASGRPLCGERVALTGAAILRPGQVTTSIVKGGMMLRIGGAAGASAVAYYPIEVLRELARPSGFVPEYGAALLDGEDRLTLRTLPRGGLLDRPEAVPSDLGIDDLQLEISMPGAPVTSPLVITTVLLVVMLIAAAAIGWFVVDILLIRPLRRLRASVGRYQPGEVIDVKRFGPMPAQEIRDLGATFRQISQTVQAHEADLAEGLVRQTKLTREVHHRVKNNLQVISSLINFHARGAKSAEASEAYASIQRRVDALAVVHRNHYAELEENRGLELRSVLGELAANIRATAPEQASGLGITLDIEPVLVTQDVAIAIAFLITEIVELAINCNPSANIRITVKGSESEPDRATLRVISPALVEDAGMEALLESRYARVMSGLARQLRTKLHHDPLVGAYEASIAITGRS
ncbi:sensor histidine kinase [Sphingomonas hengshuiensis]|uniref:histidine kinase n=1 Tax=Sphingomonas hengshuiensis TaxID=1609977 RepID=A0A7U4J894_9SPHN|nr:histidine kinase dimerization/phosphoacceptor domain -containing protein [Sphingomonas hengshuiensis]AJP72034.1 histidine kinase [Sphingomonas hengshuiensis]